MRRILIIACAVLFFGLSLVFAQQQQQQKDTKAKEVPVAAPAAIPQADIDKVNPVKSTPEGLAEAKRLYGYHCSMCHGPDGDGKGDLAVQMKLNLKNWQEPATLAKMTDGELFYIITNGRGKMEGGEGDRTKAEIRWNLVNLVRSFSVKTGQ